MYIVAAVWLGKGKAAPPLLASYFTLKLLTEYEESLLALTNNVSGYCRERMFYESNESMSQQVGSAVFYKDRIRGPFLEAPGNYRAR